MYLQKLGLPDKEIFFDDLGEDWQASVDRLEKHVRKIGDWWDVSHTLFWEMTYAAKKEVKVEHRYTPEPGGAYAVLWKGAEVSEISSAIGRLGAFPTGKETNPACLDEMTKRAITNRVKTAFAKGLDQVYVNYHYMKYILGTGRNWKGPIGQFTLRLMKEKSEQLVSVCFPGKPEKISPTVYEFRQKDYVPQDDLIVYFFTVEKEVR